MILISIFWDYSQRHTFRCQFSLKTVQPVKQIYQHLQSFLLAGLHRLTHFCPCTLRFYIALQLEVLPLERNGVVQEELGSIFEDIWESIPGEVLVEGVRDIGEHKGKVVSQVRGEDGGESGECMVGTDSDAGDGAIGEDENRSDAVNVVPDLSCNTFLTKLVSPNITSISQPRCVEDADLRKGLRVLTTFRYVGTYHYAVVAHKFVQTSRVGLGLITQITLLIGEVEDSEVVVVHSLSGKDICDEFQG